jgi:nickel-dependent lactate racemase
MKCSQDTEIYLELKPGIVTIESSKEPMPPNELEKRVTELLSPEKLKSLVDPKSDVLILTDDHTRGTPVKLVLPYLLESLRRLNILYDQITVLVATGTHRKMTAEEIEEKLGAFSKMVNIIQHSCFEDLTYLGDIDGIPVSVNKIVASSQNVIGIGSIIPHKYSGWSGGAKIICPGVCDYETIYLSHERSILIEVIEPGQHENWFRHFMDSVARNVKLRMIINFIPNMNGISDVVIGPLESAFRQGIVKAENCLLRKLKNCADMTIISAYPSTKDFWQTGKAFYTGDLVTETGGEIIVVSPLSDGLGDHHKYLNLLQYNIEDLLDAMNKRLIEDPLAAVAAVATKRILREKKITLLTTNKNFENKRIDNLKIVSMSIREIEEYLNELLRKMHNKCKILIVGDSYVLPRVGGEHT